MTSIFEAMGGYDAAPAGEAQPAKPKRRRVDEYTPRLTQGQWYILEALVNGATLAGPVENLCWLTWGDTQGWHSGATTKSLEKRGLIAKDGILYQLTDAGRHALRVREENRPGSGLI